MANFKGFTLIELMISISVLLVLISIAGPAYSSLINNNRFDGVSQEVSMGYRIARTEAVKTMQTMTLRPLVANNWNQGFEVIDASNNRIWRSASIAQGITLSGPAQIAIAANGALSASANQQISIQSTPLSQTRDLCVLIGGHGYIKQGSCS